MKRVFAITCSQHHNTLTQAQLFTTQDKARAELKSISDERRYKLGVQVFKDEPDCFSYLIGWEEHRVVFSIVELPVS